MINIAKFIDETAEMDDLQRFDRNSKIERIVWLIMGAVLVFCAFVLTMTLPPFTLNHLIGFIYVFMLYLIGIGFIFRELKWTPARNRQRRAEILAGMEMEAENKAANLKGNK